MLFDAWQQYECDSVSIHAQPESLCLGLEPGITLSDLQPLEQSSNSLEVIFLHCITARGHGNFTQEIL